MGGFADLIKAQMKGKLDELEKAKGGNGAPPLVAPRVQGRAATQMVDAAERMFGRALSPTAQEARRQERLEKTVPAPARRSAPMAIEKGAKSIEHALLATTLNFFIENSATLAPDIMGGLEMIRDEVMKEI